MSERAEKLKVNNKAGGRFNIRSLFSDGKLDATFLFLVLGILATGLVMLFSASAPYALTYYKSSYHFISRQAIFAVFGIAIMIFISKFDYRYFKILAWPLYALSIIMLIAVLFVPEVVPGFKRWLGVGMFTFQPSEVAKFSLILLFAYIISKNYDKMSDWKFDIKLLFLLGLIAGLIALEHHLSATILVLAIGYVMMIVGGMHKGLAVGILVAGICMLGALTALALKYPDKLGYIAKRINIWWDLWNYDSDYTYQTRQSLLAIGSGGVIGQGIGQSTQKYLWVPEPQNDFIFAIVCEELGLIGALLILTAFSLLVWRGLIITTRASDKFGALLTLGITFQVGLQTVLNLLVVTNSMPNTGISLPFFSYGGTSLVMLLAQMGIVLGVSRRAKIQKI